MRPSTTTFTQAVEVVRDGLVTPTRFAEMPGPLAGCVFRADGTKVALSERFGGHRSDWMRSENPDEVQPPRDAVLLRGRSIYLGHDVGGHYGHFVSEGLGAFWFFEEHPADAFDHFVLQPFIFGPGRPPHVRAVLERFGIPEERVVLVGDAPLRFEEIVVPERLFRLNHSADPRLRWVYAHIARDAAPPHPPAPRLYLSRRRLSHRRFERVVANEGRVEEVFRRHGFVVVYPEELPFLAQVALFRHAEILAGLSGSALHNSVFLRAGRRVIDIGDPRYGGEPAPNQVVCDALAGAARTFVPFAGRRFGPRRTMLLDLRALERRLAAALGEPPQRLPRVHGLAETAYLATRPALGHWARRGRRRHPRRDRPARRGNEGQADDRPPRALPRR